jgi:hypothetical protein
MKLERWEDLMPRVAEELSKFVRFSGNKDIRLDKGTNEPSDGKVERFDAESCRRIIKNVRFSGNKDVRLDKGTNEPSD